MTEKSKAHRICQEHLPILIPQINVAAVSVISPSGHVLIVAAMTPLISGAFQDGEPAEFSDCTRLRGCLNGKLENGREGYYPIS